METYVQAGAVGVAVLALTVLAAFVKLWVAQVDKLGDIIKEHTVVMTRLAMLIDGLTKTNEQMLAMVNARLLKDFRKLKKTQEE